MDRVVLRSGESVLLGDLFAAAAFAVAVEEEPYRSFAPTDRVVARASHVSVGTAQTIRHSAERLRGVQEQPDILRFGRCVLQVLLQGGCPSNREFVFRANAVSVLRKVLQVITHR